MKMSKVEVITDMLSSLIYCSQKSCSNCSYRSAGDNCKKEMADDIMSEWQKEKNFRQIMFNRCYLFSACKDGCDICIYREECESERTVKIL